MKYLSCIFNKNVTAIFFVFITNLIALLCIPNPTFAQGLDFKNEFLAKIAEPIGTEGWLKFKPGVDAATVFEKHNAAFKLGKDNKMLLIKTEKDALGYTHYRFQQIHKGLKVEGAEFLIHAKDNQALNGNGRIFPAIKTSTLPLLSTEKVIEIAKKQLPAKVYMWEDKEAEKEIKAIKKDPTASYYPNPKLLLAYANRKNLNSDSWSLCYRVEIRTKKPFDSQAVYIDAQSGKLVKQVTLLYNCTQTQGCTLYNQPNKTISTDEVSNNNFRLFDDCRGDGIHTRNADNSEIWDFDNTWIAANQCNGVSVHWALEKTYDMFLQDFTRNSYDNQGSVIEAFIDVLDDNAQWDRELKRLNFGSGGGAFTNGPLVSLDIVGHEFTHAVTQFSANLNYGDTESGGLNESFSDIFGTMVEFTEPLGDYQLGEDMWILDGYVRNMQNPKAKTGTGNPDLPSPDTYEGEFWADDLDVHYSSGVQNHWFYLLAEGSSLTDEINDNGDFISITGIGRDKAAAIAYRNLTNYLTSTSDYADARTGSLYAARGLFGDCSIELAETAKAWNAVGVYGTDVCAPSSCSFHLFANIPYSTNFDQGLDQFWCTQSETNFGRIHTTDENNPRSGEHLTMDVTTNGNLNTNEATLGLKLSGHSNVVLDFWWKEFGDETHAQDGVFLSTNAGSTYTKIHSFIPESESNNTWVPISLNLSDLASANGLTLSNTTVIKFQQYDNFPINLDGFAFEDVSVGSVYPCSISTSPTSITTSGSASSHTINVTATNTWSVSASSWMLYTPQISTGNGTITVIIGENSSGIPRTGNITITCGSSSTTIIVQQGATNTCDEIVTSYPTTESFESSFGLWSQDSNDDFDWTRDASGTPSTNTGPSSAADGTYYAFTESSGSNYPSKVANLVSPCLSMNSMTNKNISFAYHMYGAGMGSLRLQSSTDGGSSWNTIWNKSGDQTNIWTETSVSLASYTGTIQLRFNGLTGSDYRSDMAIDNIVIGGSSGCTLSTSTTSMLLGSGATTAGFNLTSDGNWTITDNVSWITINSASSGTGDATVTFSLAQNTASTNRTGTISISCQGTTETVNITQKGQSSPAYCLSQGNSASFEWIESVQVATLNNSSGNDGGYGDYTSQSAHANSGQQVGVILTPGFSSSSYSEYWKIWVDYNQDGDFTDTGEEVFSGNGSAQITGNFTVPSGLSTGTRTMRISMKYGSAPTSCESFNYGEVEDYSFGIGFIRPAAISATQTTEKAAVPTLSLSNHPNPFNNSTTIVYTLDKETETSLSITDITGRTIAQPVLSKQQASGTHQVEFQAGALPPGVYLYTLQAGEQRITKQMVILR